MVSGMRSLRVPPLVVLALCAAFAAGCASPGRDIPDGVGDYSGVEKEYARTAIEQAKLQDAEWGGPGPLITAYWVTDVRRCPGIPVRCGPAIRVREGVFRENPECEGNPFTVDVETHTFFGIPLGSADLPCDG